MTKDKDNLIKSIIADAEKQAEKIIKEADKQNREKTKSIIADAEKQAEKIIKEAEAQAILFEKRKLFESKQKAKKIILQEQKQLINKIFDELLEYIKNIDSKDRDDILKNFVNIAQNQIKDIDLIYALPRDVKKLKKYTDFEVREKKDIDFGIIAISKDKKQCVDLSLSNLKEIIQNKISLY